MAITPAMCEGSGMVQFAKEYPERFFDVAIAEAACSDACRWYGLRRFKTGRRNLFNFPATGYDQLVHDVALQNLDVTFGIDRAGLVGEDGPTHAGAMTMPICVPFRIW